MLHLPLLSIFMLTLPATAHASQIFELSSTRAGDRFGTALDSAGDVDADGTEDWIIGAPRAALAGLAAGRVLVVSGRDGSELQHFIGDPGAVLGAAVAGAGDLDGDGHGDLLAGAPFGAGGKGEVRLWSGASGALLRSWVGVVAGDQFGASVCSPGDVDGDGVGDVLIGAPHSDVGGTHAGEAYVFSGATGALLFEFAGSAWDQYGRAVAGLGDVNGDGRADFAVGVPFSDLAGFNAGRVVAYSGLQGTVLFEHTGQTAGDQFGFALAAGEDVSGDGVGDLAVIAPAADAAGFDSGSLTLLGGADGSLLFTIPGPGPSSYMSAGELIADLDGDGLAEILTGTPAAPSGSHEAGLLRLHSGADGSLLRRRRGPAAWGWFGMAIAAGGDTNGDGVPEFLVGAPGHDDHFEFVGRVRVYSGATL